MGENSVSDDLSLDPIFKMCIITLAFFEWLQYMVHFLAVRLPGKVMEDCTEFCLELYLESLSF